MKPELPAIALERRTRLFNFGPEGLRWWVIRLTTTTVTLQVELNDFEMEDGIDVCEVTFERKCHPLFEDLRDPAQKTIDLHAVPISVSGRLIENWLLQHRGLRVLPDPREGVRWGDDQ